MSEPWTSLKLIKWTSEYFEKKGVPNPRLDAELLLSHVLKCKRLDLYLSFEKTVSENHLAKFKELIERRVKREPLQYILGETEFWGLKIKVTPDVLIPRPETELLVEEALKGAPTNILDICTGSGCIAIALAKNLPESKIIATDISKEALTIARQNAEENGVADRIEFHLADIAPWNIFKAEGRMFDLIVSNPPYIPHDEIETLQEEVRAFEPKQALDGGPDGLAIILQIIEESQNFIVPEGFLTLEVGEKQAEQIESQKLPSAWQVHHIRKDYNDIERIVILKKISS